MVYRVFRRPAIDLDSARKTWKMREAKDIKVGSIIVPNAGEVVSIETKTREEKLFISFTFLSGGFVEYSEDTLLQSFQED